MNRRYEDLTGPEVATEISSLSEAMEEIKTPSTSVDDTAAGQQPPGGRYDSVRLVFITVSKFS